MDNIGDFLKETRFCDFSNEKIKNLAEKIVEGAKDDREFAVSAFYWVRDNILYRVGNWQREASETLIEKSGTCTNKANLLVALLRYKKIPAGYGVMKVYGQRYFGPIATPTFRKFVSKTSTHIYPLVYLSNGWIKCDPTDDKEFCDNTSYFNPTSQLVDWDGQRDAVMNLFKEDIISEEFPIADVDPWMLKKANNAKEIHLKIANIYIKFARENKQIVSGADELEKLFREYLIKKHFLYFCFLNILSFLKDIELNVFTKNAKNS